MDVHEQLVAARNLIARDGWAPNGKREFGRRCTIQATYDVAGSCKAAEDADRALMAAVGLKSNGLSPGFDLLCWNDEPGRTKEEVLALFDKAISATAPEPYVELEVEEPTCVA